MRSKKMQLHIGASRLHRWLALIIGVQLLLWFTSGLVMSLLPIDRVRGEHLVERDAGGLLPVQAYAPLDRIAGGTPLRSARYRLLLGRPVVEVESASGELRLHDAATGAALLLAIPGAPLLHAYGHNLHTYSDNLGIFVNREQADAIVDLLQKAFASSPAGPFFLRAAPPKPISQPFKFLGYWFRLVDGAAEVFVPPEFAQHRADAILGDLMTADLSGLKKVRKRIEGVAGEWARWNGVDAWKRSALQRVATAEEALDAFGRRGACVPSVEVSSLRSTSGAHLRLQ